MSGSKIDPNGEELTEFLRDFGANLIQIGWPIGEADRAVGYVRRAHERGERFGDALGAVWQMHRDGKLIPKETE